MFLCINVVVKILVFFHFCLNSAWNLAKYLFIKLFVKKILYGATSIRTHYYIQIICIYFHDFVYK